MSRSTNSRISLLAFGLTLIAGSALVAGSAAAQVLCTDSCSFAHDGECDDGGPDSLYDVCQLGTDCDDCGPRAAATPPPEGALCTDACEFAHDGECDDGGPNSLFDVCEFGTDCTDCGPRLLAAPINPPTGIIAPTLCSDTCEFAHDSECDDGGPSSLYDLCPLGTDCSDCGPRVTEVTPPVGLQPIMPDAPGEPSVPDVPSQTQPPRPTVSRVDQSRLPSTLRSALQASCRTPNCGTEIGVMMADLNGDGAEEYILIDQLSWVTYLFQPVGGNWQLAGLVEGGHGYASVALGSEHNLGYWDVAYSARLFDCQTQITLRFNGLLYEQLAPVRSGCDD